MATFPKPETVIGYTEFKPNAEALVNETVKEDYIVKTQNQITQATRDILMKHNAVLLLKKTN